MYYDKTAKKLMLSGRETVFYARRRLAVAYREEEREEGGDPVLGAFRERLFGGDTATTLTGDFSRGGYDFTVTMTVDRIEGGEVAIVRRVAGFPERADAETLRSVRGEGYLAAYLAGFTGGGDVRLRLYLVSELSPLPHIIDDVPARGAPARFFEKLCDAVAEHAAPLIERAAVRLPTMATAAFPYPTVREGQAELMETVYAVIAHGRRLYASAPTGTGKTMSVLYPAVRALGAGKTDKVFYLTSKNTTADAAAEALRRLYDSGADVRGVMLTSREALCPRNRVCQGGDVCDLSPLAPTREDAAVRELLDARLPVVSAKELLAAAERHLVCPCELMLRYSLYCDVVIGDYNYLFDPAVALRRYFEEGGNYTFLVDEAHNLVERARSIHHTEMSLSYLARLAAAVRGQAPLEDAVGTFRVYYEGMMKRALHGEVREEKDGAKSAFAASRELPEGYVTEFCALTYALLGAYRTARGEVRARLKPFVWHLKKAADALTDYDTHDITFLRLTGGDLTLETICLDPAAVVDRRLSLGRSAVLFSATLSPIAYYREVLGGRPGDRELELPSPFEEGHLAVAVMDKISTRYLERETTVRAVLRAILTTVKAKPGNYMVFCPSYAYLTRLAEALHRAVPALDILTQKPHMNAEERAAFLARFDANPSRALIGFCVMGGIYSEGIDLVGRRLVGAVIVGVGLPSVSDEREAIAAYFDDKSEEGRGYAYVYPGMNRVLQAAGRVIRSEGDRGVVLLIDDRFASPEYRRLLPAHWHGLHFVGDTEGLAHLLGNFWRGGKA